jgi:hypothetical protein
MGTALLVSQSVPRSLAATYLLATVATAAAVPGTPIGPISFGVITAVSVAFARRITGPSHDPQG